ncbi:hypothetical protein J2T60_000148 [Natronospira proteinivora]|uniref:Uncharacterized protein n=1 Tax=Natronospira proteinivora TaxID=1807133 RepID=A0ABT1G740_9GAMM|nr:hypothetical protein [Natronospira proteinivora]MCP1726183.1 hypothetical protein [Natronospira proteinivora]
MSARLREGRLSVHACFSLLIVLAALLVGCDTGTDVDEQDAATPQASRDELVAQPSGLRVAASIPAEAEQAEFLRHQEAAHLLDAAHAVFMHAARARDSEMGHEAYRPELQEDFMEARAWLWLQLVEAVQSRHGDGIAMQPESRWDGNDWVAEGEPRPADLVWGVYLYHMHHREGWFEDETLRDSITRYPLGLLTGLSRHVYDGFYHDGRFHDGSDAQAVSLESMMEGLAAAHAMAYAWIRWQKPGGAEDMGGLERERLAGWLGRDPDQLLEKARAISEVLDEAWQEDRGYYHFDSDEMSLKTLGSLIRGHKGLYETLYIFGDESDRAVARTLFERSARMLEDAISLSADWGLPSRFRLGDAGLEVASEVVDVAAHWNLIAHISGGFSFDREREGTARLMSRHRSEFSQLLGRWIDEQIQGAMDYQMPDGILVSRLDFESGDVLDADHALRAISRFMIGAGEGYGSGDHFASPADWSDDPDKEAATRQLYQVLLDHGRFVEERLITGAR